MRMRIGLVAVVMGCAGLGVAGAAVAQDAARARTAGLDRPVWRVFEDRAGTRVDVPAGIFTEAVGPAPRGDGVELRSADGRARLMVYVEENDEAFTPARFVRTNLKVPAGALDYRRVTDRFFAVSGVNDDEIFYSRCNFPARAAGRMHCIYVAYPRAEEKAWDDIVTRISLSLRGSRS
ncbi:hypothetical protein PQJ75_05975 [Rhodoplanes sp. TEM]|uniref:Lipoprotein n=1 Tax=Rhodoplanes tepidamans TaxID=200616 RepID=A0ABT5J3G4_RHOTP|nr:MULTISPECIES: hypothetical protein [Rhodoplanes]MDC7784178.1 hypothetical protein [Rhodoplanes tepidamans]MDC7983273.1 hypothetical protein [Rhodoplanes sp. TEM]MDQ0356724.1 hypothetical protein [Rhodoplanes tepidamans]